MKTKFRNKKKKTKVADVLLFDWIFVFFSSLCDQAWISNVYELIEKKHDKRKFTFKFKFDFIDFYLIKTVYLNTGHNLEINKTNTKSTWYIIHRKQN